MTSIPELASKELDKVIGKQVDLNARTVFLCGSKYVGKTSILYNFLEKTDQPRETLVLEYSFARKSVQKQGLEKNICHVWEYGGKLDTLKNVLSSVPINGKGYFIVMVDLSKIKSIWNILETCLNAITQTYANTKLDLIIVGGKYDLFKNYDNEIKKIICTTMRSIAYLYGAHLVYYSNKEPQLVRKMKEIFHSIAFDSGFSLKEKNSNYTKPLFIPKGTDSWESIGSTNQSFEQVKTHHLSRIPPDNSQDIAGTSYLPKSSHPEPRLDALVALKYDELRNLDYLDKSISEYLIFLQ